MSRPSRTLSAVALAQREVEIKAAELRAAEALVRQRNEEHASAVKAVHQAQLAADADMPKCRLVRIGWRSGSEQTLSSAVILRKTPGGMLVVRCMGDTEGERRFKWRSIRGVFVEAKKQTSYIYDHIELRDVPAEYLPVTKGGAV